MWRKTQSYMKHDMNPDKMPKTKHSTRKIYPVSLISDMDTKEKKVKEPVKKERWKCDIDALEELYSDKREESYGDSLARRWQGYEVYIDESGNLCCTFEERE